MLDENVVMRQNLFAEMVFPTPVHDYTMDSNGKPLPPDVLAKVVRRLNLREMSYRHRFTRGKFVHRHKGRRPKHG